MAEFTPGAMKLVTYWGGIQQAATGREGVAGAWARVNALAAADQMTIKGGSIFDMNTLYSRAVANRNAMESLAAAPSPGTIDFTMMGSELYARSQAEFNAAPLYIVRFEHNVLENGEPETLWRTDTFRGYLPPTKDALMEQLDADAQLLGDEYNQSHVSIGSISVNVA
jgi:hypothetical protein